MGINIFRPNKCLVVTIISIGYTISAQSLAQNTTDNTVKLYSAHNRSINGDIIIGDSLYGGIDTAGDIDGKTTSVINESSPSITNVYGGYTDNGDVIGNNAIITSSNIVKNGSQIIVGGQTVNGNAINNTVTITDSTVYTNLSGNNYAGGIVLANGNTNDNKIIVSDTTLKKGSVSGGYTNNGNSNSNIAIIHNSTGISNVHGGSSTTNKNAEDNRIEFSGTSEAESLFGGYAGDGGSAINNQIIVTGGVISLGIMGGEGTTGKAIGNTVTLSFGTSNGIIFGGYIHSTGSSEKNNIFIKGGTVQNQIHGGFSQDGDVIENVLSISGGTVSELVTGGWANFMGKADGNRVLVSDNGQLESAAIGGFSTAGISQNNNVTMTGGVISGEIRGGWSKIGSVINNSVLISGGKAESSVFGGISTDGGNVTNNHVTITGGEIKADIFGGFSRAVTNNTTGGNTLDNTVTLTGENIKIIGSVYGGSSNNSNGTILADFDKVVKGNTLNLSGYRGSIAGIYNFENYNWLLPKDVANREAALIHITGNTPVNLDNSKHTVAIYNDGNRLNAGDKIYLIDKASGMPTLLTPQISQGHFLIYDVTMDVEGNDLVLNINKKTDNSLPAHTNPRTKAFSEGRAAALGFLSSDLVASSIYLLRKTTEQQSDEHALVPFIFSEGSSRHYQSGRNIDIKGFEIVAGFARLMKTQKGHNIVIGTFFENGNASYDTSNSFSNLASVKGNGKTRYTGGGILGRIDFAGTSLESIALKQNTGLYMESSLRAGRVKNDYGSSDLVDPEGRRGQYNSKTGYFAAHGAVGYVFSLDEKRSFDIYSRYLYTYMDSDIVTIGKDRLHFDHSISSRIQLGGRYEYQYTNQVKTFVGTAYEYESKGGISAKAYNLNLKKVSLKGSTGIFEAGLNIIPFKTHDNISLDLKGRGFVGKRPGGGGNIKLTVTF